MQKQANRSASPSDIGTGESQLVAMRYTQQVSVPTESALSPLLMIGPHGFGMRKQEKRWVSHCDMKIRLVQRALVPMENTLSLPLMMPRAFGMRKQEKRWVSHCDTKVG